MSSDIYGQIIGGMFGGFSSGMQTSANKDIQASANTRAWHRYLWARSTQYQTAVADLRAAGLNPMLAYTQGGAGAMMPSSAATASTPDVGGAIESGMAAGRQAALFAPLLEKAKADSKRAVAEASSAESEADVNSYLRDARMKLGAISVEQARQMVESTISSRRYTNTQQLRQELEIRLGKLGLNEAQAESEYYGTAAGKSAVERNRAITNYLPFLTGAGHLRSMAR